LEMFSARPAGPEQHDPEPVVHRPRSGMLPRTPCRAKRRFAHEQHGFYEAITLTTPREAG